MGKPKKVIISAAITGAIHTPSMSPYFPASPEQIAQQAIDASKRERPLCTSMPAELTECLLEISKHFAGSSPP